MNVHFLKRVVVPCESSALSGDHAAPGSFLRKPPFIYRSLYSGAGRPRRAVPLRSLIINFRLGFPSPLRFPFGVFIIGGRGREGGGIEVNTVKCGVQGATTLISNSRREKLDAPTRGQSGKKMASVTDGPFAAISPS